MNKRFAILLLLAVPLIQGHHYKGLPHYGYFENYPQVPTLEFLKETPRHEVFVTIYNFQGLNMDKVDAPDDVRFYVFVYDLVTDRIYTGEAQFSIYASGKLIHKTGTIKPEQEAIYVLEDKIEQQNDLKLDLTVLGADGERTTISLPIRITQTLFQKYGVVAVVILFFVAVSSLKTILNRRERHLTPATA